jgi:hypothetical protein
MRSPLFSFTFQPPHGLRRNPLTRSEALFLQVI